MLKPARHPAYCRSSLIFSAAVLAVLVSGSSAEAKAGRCLLESTYCDDFSGSDGKLLGLMRKKPSQYIGMDQTSVSIVYSTLEKGQKKADKNCRQKDKVSLDGFRAMFVVGSGKSKRALMLKNKNTCTWVKVK